MTYALIFWVGAYSGITADSRPMRDYASCTAAQAHFATTSPIDYAYVCRVWGCQPDNDDETRAAFMRVWAALRYECADAMLEARKR